MTTWQVFEWMLLLMFFGVVCEAMIRWKNSPGCPMCGGRQKHEEDCPWRR